MPDTTDRDRPTDSSSPQPQTPARQRRRLPHRGRPEPLRPASRVLRIAGPGLITGASDDDPSGIGTYSQVGAAFGTGFLWMALYILPLVICVQEMCGRIGLVTGRGIAGCVRRYSNRQVLLGAVLLLFIANTINVGADLGAMAASVRLLAPGVALRRNPHRLRGGHPAAGNLHPLSLLCARPQGADALAAGLSGHGHPDSPATGSRCCGKRSFRRFSSRRSSWRWPSPCWGRPSALICSSGRRRRRSRRSTSAKHKRSAGRHWQSSGPEAGRASRDTASCHARAAARYRPGHGRRPRRRSGSSSWRPG